MFSPLIENQRGRSEQDKINPRATTLFLTRNQARVESEPLGTDAEFTIVKSSNVFGSSAYSRFNNRIAEISKLWLSVSTEIFNERAELFAMIACYRF
jgi:hypothetical protein